MRILTLAIVAILYIGLNQTNALRDNEACDACQKWSNFIWNITHNMNDELYDSMSKLCSDYSELPKQSFCNKTVHALIGFLNQRWDKDKICYDIKACQDSNDDGVREFDDFLVNDDVDCKFCIYVNSKIKELMTGSPTELELKTHFEDACHYLKSFEQECLGMVDEYIDMLFQYMKESFVPENLCKSLRVCPKQTGPLKKENSIRLPSASEMINIMPVNMSLVYPKEATSRETPTCMICKKLVKIIQRQLQDNATDEQIINVLTEVCQLFPRKDIDNCQKVVSNYVKQLIQILSQDIDSDTACLLAGLCGNQSLNDYLKGTLIDRQHQLNGNALCTECELIAHFIQNSIYDYQTEEQIENFIKNHLCDKMSFIINTANCQAFIDQYGPIIMQTIAQDVFNPDMLCFKELKLCKRAKIHVITPQSHDRCQICQEIVKDLANGSYNDIEIDRIVERGCSRLPKSHQVDCALLIKTFSPYFLDMLDRYDNAEKICESVDICLIPGKIHKLGGHKCTYGPSYWCHSVTHANSCNAFKYCHQKVWNSNDNNNNNN